MTSNLVSAYAVRARYYDYEFSFRDDRSLLEAFVSKSIGPILEVPCGSGRNLDLYRTISRPVDLVDIEPEMIRKTALKVQSSHDLRSVQPQLGDMLSWSRENYYSLILSPRGGLQCLSKGEDVAIALKRFIDNLSVGGCLFFDLANLDSENLQSALIPTFLRFAPGSKHLEGEDVFKIEKEAVLVRKYMSRDEGAFVRVQFAYQVKSSIAAKPEHEYEATNHWLRISRSNIVNILRDMSSSLSFLGDYFGKPFEEGDARIICVVVK